MIVRKYRSSITLEYLGIHLVFRGISIESFWIWTSKKKFNWKSTGIDKYFSFYSVLLTDQNLHRRIEAEELFHFLWHTESSSRSTNYFFTSFLFPSGRLSKLNLILPKAPYFLENIRVPSSLEYLIIGLCIDLCLYNHRSSLSFLNWIISSWTIIRNSIIWNNNSSKPFDIIRRYFHYNYSKRFINIYPSHLSTLMTYTFNLTTMNCVLYLDSEVTIVSWP